MTSYFYNNEKIFKIFNVTHPLDLSAFRWTVDRKPDYDLVKSIIGKIHKKPILMNDIIDLLSNDKILFVIGLITGK